MSSADLHSFFTNTEMATPASGMNIFDDKEMDEPGCPTGLFENKSMGYQFLMKMIEFLNNNISSDAIYESVNEMISSLSPGLRSSFYLVDDGIIGLVDTSCTPNCASHYQVLFQKKSESREIRFIRILKSERCDAASFVLVPLWKNDSLLGYFVAEHTTQGFFNIAQTPFWETVATHLSTAVYNNIRYRELKDCSNKDSLVGVWTRRYFFEIAKKDAAACNTLPTAYAMIDLDYFKEVNDSYGHQFGDEVLRVVAGLIADGISEDDVVARYGGEEFIVLLHANDPVQVMESIRKKIEGFCIIRDSISCSVTVSIGLSQMENNESVDNAIMRADVNLYKAKRSGRNKTVFSF